VQLSLLAFQEIPMTLLQRLIPIIILKCFNLFFVGIKVGLTSKETTGTLIVPAPSAVLDIQYAGAASSYAPGTFFESLPTNLSTKLGMTLLPFLHEIVSVYNNKASSSPIGHQALHFQVLNHFTLVMVEQRKTSHSSPFCREVLRRLCYS